MTYWAKMELYEVTQWRDGCIYGTRLLGHQWFPGLATPQPGVVVDNRQWVNTTDAVFGPQPPSLEFQPHRR